MHLWYEYHAPASLDEALALLAEQGERARIIAGGTDLIIELDRGVRHLERVVDITRIAGLDEIRVEDDVAHVGPLVTHNQVANDGVILALGFPLAQAAWEVGAPQLRNRGTVAGNLITASPANDTITPLMALGAAVTLTSAARGPRTVPLAQFYRGVRETELQPDEMLVDIIVPLLDRNQRGTFLKLALRQAQAISVVNVAVVLTGAGDPDEPFQLPVSDVRIAMGSVAPTIIRAPAAERELVGSHLTEREISGAAALAAEAAAPIDDVRSPARYRSQMIRVLTARALRALRDGQERDAYPHMRANLWQRAGHPSSRTPGYSVREDGTIATSINGRRVTLRGAAGKTLLRALREDAGLTGTKEGCAEGECGACTVILDGAAVVSCLVPAERAHGATILTIEGLATDDELHPVQRAFVEHDAAQCGYCTPGFIMSAAALLDEVASPTLDQVKQAISGNLCRCTGYYKILEAIQAASTDRGQRMASGHNG
ncbi:MAG: FAD binding domain-containing protein [Ardenticatenaceae bacterium]|nr:FAD binding domain-containing protein [Ardenticatenaceae bacterium]